MPARQVSLAMESFDATLGKCAVSEEPSEFHSILEQLGRPRALDVWGEIGDLPVISQLLKYGKAKVVSSPYHKWKHVTNRYEVVDGEAAEKELVELIVSRRKEAVKDMLRVMEDIFTLAEENKEPEKWRMIILKDEWLRETVCRGEGKMVSIVDATFCFERKEHGEQSESQGQVGADQGRPAQIAKGAASGADREASG